VNDRSIRVLLVEDDPEYAYLMQEMLAVAWGARLGLELTDQLSTGLERLAAGGIDVVLLDLSLPDSQGLDTFTRMHTQTPGVPVIVLSGLSDEALAVEVVREGAQDYLVKGQEDGKLLVRAIRYAIERKRAEEALSWEAAVNASLAELSRALLQLASIDDVSSLVLESARHLTGSALAFVGHIDSQTGSLVCGATTKVFPDTCPVPGKDTFPTAPGGLWRWVLENQEPLLTNNPSDDPRSTETPQGHLPIHRFLAVPALAGDTVGGTLVGLVALANADRDYSRQDLALVERLAALYALAIQQKRNEDELRQRNKELVARNVIATTISQSPDLDHILNATLDRVLEVIDIDAGWIQLLDEDAGLLSLVAHRGFSPEMAEETETIKLGEGLTGKVAQSAAPIVLDKAADDPRLSAEAVRRERLHAFASVPVKSKDKVLGVMGVFSRGPRRTSPQEVQLLTAIGHQVGVAIENTRLRRETSGIELLHELNRLRSELIANVSHELRTPLGLIKAFCTTLLREDVDLDRETQREFLRDIDQETDKLEKIVDNLLDLSRMENGRLRMDKQATDLGHLARGVVEAMKMDIQPRQHHLVHDFPPTPLVATVDAKRIEQVLRNLLGNSIKYSPGGGTITVGGRGDGRQFLVWVSDQGIGIPRKDLGAIFDRFYRVENEVTRNTSGAGLGLAVCQGIVEAHGGRIWAESTPGVGSTFYFTVERDA
jgi:signal transduction histidine kinase/FixJ family two-component response regulator